MVQTRRFDTVRNKAKSLLQPSRYSDLMGHKVIIVDEADNTSHDVQLALRAFVESSMATVDSSSPVTSSTKSSHLPQQVLRHQLQVKGNQKAKLAAAFFNRVRSILESEVWDMIQRLSRSNQQTLLTSAVLNELQRYSVNGQIDTAAF